MEVKNEFYKYSIHQLEVYFLYIYISFYRSGAPLWITLSLICKSVSRQPTIFYSAQHHWIELYACSWSPTGLYLSIKPGSFHPSYLPIFSHLKPPSLLLLSPLPSSSPFISLSLSWSQFKSPFMSNLSWYQTHFISLNLLINPYFYLLKILTNAYICHRRNGSVSEYWFFLNTVKYNVFICNPTIFVKLCFYSWKDHNKAIYIYIFFLLIPTNMTASATSHPPRPNFNPSLVYYFWLWSVYVISLKSALGTNTVYKKINSM